MRGVRGIVWREGSSVLRDSIELAGEVGEKHTVDECERREVGQQGERM
jgi:hypothetical protein